jgi:hypothetical protein
MERGMARMTNFDITSYIWTCAIGLPMLAVAAWLWWRFSRPRFFWLSVLCAIIAFFMTPFVFKDESIDNAVLLLAVMMFLLSRPTYRFD